MKGYLADHAALFRHLSGLIFLGFTFYFALLWSFTWLQEQPFGMQSKRRTAAVVIYGFVLVCVFISLISELGWWSTS